MKVQIAALSLAIALYCSPAFAQHGHSGSAMGHMDGGNGHVMNTNAHGNSSSTGSHGMTMDQQLSKNTKLAGTIKTLTGLDAQTACDGFKNLGQCVAAAHVSHNLKISFDCLKSDMIGTAPTTTGCPDGTGSGKMSLGKSIQTLKPDADSKSESKKGQQEADQDLKSNS
jgi:hypothetical protein